LPSLHGRIPLTFAFAATSLAVTTDAGQGVDVDAYVQVVLRSHPIARQSAALENAAAAERKAVRVLPDPAFEYSRDHARRIDRPADREGSRVSERSFSVTQTIPWPGTWSASKRAGDRTADALRAEGTGARWDLEIEARTAFARVLSTRGALEAARGAEADALALRDLTAKRAELGESREADRIKAEVEWLRQQRIRRAAEREAETAETLARTLAVEPLPRPLVLVGELPRPLPPTDAAALRERMNRSNPRLLAAQAAVEREAALASVARRRRIPDLDVTWFHEDELDKEASGFSFGVRVPLWNAQRGEIARAEAASALAAVGAQRARLDLTAALERARQELDVASAQAEILEREILPAATRSLELARFSYQEGETSLLDLLDAQRTFRETQSEAAASRLALALALAEVQRLVGPDFSPWR
jgi:cobalt-zinc-cadmium efflux system outer membrane protein